MTRPGLEAQRGRLAEVWRASAPSNEEIERLRARIATHPARRRPSRKKLLVVALVQGFMMGGATLAAAAWIAGRTLPLFEHPTVQAGAAEHGSRATKTLHAKQSSRAGATDGETAAVVPHAAFGDVAEPAGPPADSPPAEGEAKRAVPAEAVATGSAPLHARATTSRDRVQANERTTLRAESEPEGPVAEAEPARIASDGPWGRVARALSASDWQRADAALVELARAADPATRDAADLARAELWIAHGHGDAFRPNVERLARDGYTPLIRRRAARLLDRLP
jgi:hypothetical protein